MRGNDSNHLKIRKEKKKYCDVIYQRIGIKFK